MEGQVVALGTGGPVGPGAERLTGGGTGRDGACRPRLGGRARAAVVSPGPARAAAVSPGHVRALPAVSNSSATPLRSGARPHAAATTSSSIPYRCARIVSGGR